MRTWLAGVVMLFLGMGCCAFGFLGLRTGSGTSVTGPTVLLFVGVAIVACTMVTMVRRALRVLADETCLILRVDGICFQRNTSATVVPWAAIDAVRADGDALVIDTDDPKIGQIRMAAHFPGIDAAELADRIVKTQRRVLMGMI